MSIHPRPEAAPAMKTLHFETIDQLLDSHFKSSGLLFQGMSSLTLEAGHQSEKFLKALGYLIAGKFTLPVAVIKLRERDLISVRYTDSERDQINAASLTSTREKTERVAIRKLEISNCKIDEKGLQALVDLISGHETLSTLSLKVNGITSSLPSSMPAFARSVNLSNLRSLELSNNPIGTRSMVQLLNHLDSPNLTHLYLSMTLIKRHLEEDQQNNPLWTNGDQFWREESIDVVWKREINKVVDALVGIISNNRNGGYLPRLERLSLNGNDLGWNRVRRIVESVLEGNKNLTEIELFATTQSSDSDDEDDKESQSRRPRRSNSIGTIFLRNQQRNREANRQVQGTTTPPISRTVRDIQSDESAVEPVTTINWRFRLGKHLWQNRTNRMAVKDSSRYMLRIARVLTCKCRQGPVQDSPSFFPFTSLPPEIRAKIISHLDDKKVLSSRQVQRIISFASNAATLGYGCKSAQLGLSTFALQQIQEESKSDYNSTSIDTQDYGLLPHHRWSWKEMMREFSSPRDWPVTILDEVKQRSEEDDNQRDMQGLGGGGPDGRGGLTYEWSGPDASRRRWLEEQSGLHAFWESTGTYREE